MGLPFFKHIMQQIVIRGNLVKDAELVQIGERQQVKFKVACNEGKGERKVTTYYDVLSYAVAVQPYLLKGKDVITVGRLSVRQSQGKDGKTYTNLNVYADGVEMCGRRDDSHTTTDPQVQYQPNYAGYNGPANAQPQPVAEDDGLPF